VQTADATLFPLNPSLTPLTTIGISKMVAIDKTDKSLLFAENADIEKDGIYVFDETSRPFSLFPALKLLVAKTLFPADVSIIPTSVIFSPDYKQAIINLKRGEDTVSYLISTENETTQLFEVTSSGESLIMAWDTERAKEAARLLEIFPRAFQKIASDSFTILALSPDKTKVLYWGKQEVELPVVIVPRLLGANQTAEHRKLTADGLYVYDRKEDRNYKIEGEEQVMWFADSDHLVASNKHVFEIMDFDGTNRQVVYSGPHEGSYFDVTSDGKLLILANFNPDFNKKPDLYAVGIK